MMLSIGIGSTAAAFAVVNSVLLRPLAYRDPRQLYVINEIVPEMAKLYPRLAANLPDFRIWQRDVHAFAGIAVAEQASADLTGRAAAEEIVGVRSSANLFDVLGVVPVLGRSFLSEEDSAGRGRVVILTDAFWRSHFHADPTLVGHSITLDGSPYVVVGVLPPSFHFPERLGRGAAFGRAIDFFEPLDGEREYERGLISEFDFGAIARLRPGVAPQQALAELNVVQTRIAQEANEGVALEAAISPLDAEVVGTARQGLAMLLGAALVVLLIVCVNLANLLLTRVPSRMREAAIRTALGASPPQLFRRSMIESLLLGVAGGALGIVVGRLGLASLIHAAPAGLPRLDEIHLDGATILLVVALSITAGVVFGVVPAWRIASGHPQESLKAGSLTMADSREARRVRESMVGVEVGLSTLLVVTAALLVSSLAHVLRVRAGFATERVLTAQLDMPIAYAEPGARERFYQGLVDRLRAVPGIRAVGWTSVLPLDGEESVTGIDVPGSTAKVAPQANYRPVSLDYFAAAGIPVLRGRAFSESDRGRHQVVISASAAERFWPGEDPIGRSVVTQWGPPETDDVVGVVGDIHTVSLDAAPVMMVYVPEWFDSVRHLGVPRSAGFVVRTAVDERGIENVVRGVIHAADPTVPIVRLRSMRETVSESVASRRFQTVVALGFALVALVLASLGIYGVIAYSVEQRRRELGIRAAIGARRADLRGMVLRQGMTPVLAGIATGLAGSVVTGRLLGSLLFGVGGTDPATLAATASAVLVVAAAACYVPARRATRIDPIVALRE
jgi:predicted permease